MGKSVTIDFKTLKNLTPASFEYLKCYVNNVETLNNGEIYHIFGKQTKYSENYASEIHSKLKPLLSEFKKIVKKKTEVEFIRIPISSIASFFNGKITKNEDEEDT